MHFIGGGGKFNTYGIKSTSYNTYFNSNNTIKYLTEKEFTITFWGNYSKAGSYGCGLFGNYRYSTESDSNKGLLIFSRWGASSKDYGISFSNNGTVYKRCGSNSEIINNTWVHFAVTKNNQNLITIYINGINKGSIQANITDGIDSRLFYNYFRVSDAWDERYTIGTVDDILICDKVLFKENFTVPEYSNLQTFYAQYGNKIYEDSYDNAYTIPKQSELINDENIN